jgi:hypothetical protein
MVANMLSVLRKVGAGCFSAVLLFALLVVPALTPRVHALSGSSFNAGRIIDNSVFTNTGTMSAAAIQTFLNNEDPSCDTYGATTMSYYYNSSTGEVNNSSGGTWVSSTRAIYGQRYATWYNAHPTTGYITNESVGPYVCIPNYLENPTTGQNNLQNPSLSVSGGESAAQIIYNAAQQYQINPQVLITTLQKEQGLITDTWPWVNEYRAAMGFNCTDSAPCSGFAGFYQQVSAAAKQFRNYLNNPNDFNYVVGNNKILYSPASCGSSTVNVQNLATAALYDYTPYQPDSTVLTDTNPTGSASGPGSASGDSCSDPTYGNRNFWWYFNTWFGSTISSGLPGCAPATNTTLTCVWSLSNPSNFDQYLTSSISTRDELFTTQDYQYLGVSFYGNVVSEPGNIPVYRASSVGGGSFITTSQAEYNSLVSGGYTGDGIDFYADPPGSNMGFPVYRLYNASTTQHYWTSDTSEVSSLESSGWTSEGLAFNSIDTIRQETPPPSGDLLVYRFYIPQTTSHFWTTDLGERDSMINAGYDYEGVSWFSSQNTSDTPVYRLYAPSIQQHLYTTDLNEKRTLVASGAWNDEGIDQYVSSTPTSQPIYRLYAPSLGVHFYTGSSNERNTLIASGGWQNEGIAWYQP